MPAAAERKSTIFSPVKSAGSDITSSHLPLAAKLCIKNEPQPTPPGGVYIVSPVNANMSPSMEIGRLAVLVERAASPER